MGNCHIRRIGDLYSVLFCKPSMVHIHIINSNSAATLVARGISGYIRYIFFFTHSRVLPASFWISSDMKVSSFRLRLLYLLSCLKSIKINLFFYFVISL